MRSFNVLRHITAGGTGRIKTRVAMALFASLLATAVLSPAPSSARDDPDLNERKNRLDNAIDDQHADLDEISTDLRRAQARVEAAVGALAGARVTLAAFRDQVRAAALLDRQLQARLDQAVVRLRDARADLEAGQRDVIDRRSDLAGYSISNFQTGGVGALSLGLGFDAATTHQAVDALQGIDAVGNKQAVVLQELEAAEVILTLTEERVEDTKDDVQRQRVDAAENLDDKRRLEAAAQTAKGAVVTRVAGLRVQREQVAAAKQRELSRLDTLESERNRVEERLRAIAERRADRRGSRVSAPPADSGGVLRYPVTNTYVTSPYGMRLHPILNVYKLHDGTDFHAPCGTPVYAAAAGTVTSAYYNTGYGNTILLDHGYVRGASLWTSYSHLTAFAAGTGERVAAGELIGYAGTTGYSTACHLHFMVYANGGTVDPLSWL